MHLKENMLRSTRLQWLTKRIKATKGPVRRARLIAEREQVRAWPLRVCPDWEEPKIVRKKQSDCIGKQVVFRKES